MQEQTLETNRPMEVPLRLIHIVTASAKECICYDLDAFLPDEERYLVDCGMADKLDSRRLYRLQEDDTYVRISDGAVVSLPTAEPQEFRTLPDEELPDALYCAKWGIVDEYPGSRCAVYVEDAEIEP